MLFLTFFLQNRFPSDKNLTDLDEQMLLGPALLVSPVLYEV